jgi:hypothetical protein
MPTAIVIQLALRSSTSSPARPDASPAPDSLQQPPVRSHSQPLSYHSSTVPSATAPVHPPTASSFSPTQPQGSSSTAQPQASGPVTPYMACAAITLPGLMMTSLLSVCVLSANVLSIFDYRTALTFKRALVGLTENTTSIVERNGSCLLRVLNHCCAYRHAHRMSS